MVGDNCVCILAEASLIKLAIDEKNIPLLHEMMDLEKSSTSLFKKLYLDDVTDPGLPPSTVIKAIGAWLAVRLDMVTMYEDTPEHVDEKVFALTPFALASFKVCLVDFCQLLHLTRDPIVSFIHRALDVPGTALDKSSA
jgi:hypothetical protein